MANEIYIPGLGTGLTVTVQLYKGTATVGTAFSAAEIGTTGNYSADMPAGVAYGHYFLTAIAAAVVVATGEIYWDGNYEITDSLAKVQGLDKLNPATTTPASLVAGNVNIAISGDGVASTTFTRT